MAQKLGKITREDLERIFTRRTGAHRPNVLQGPRFGVDTAIVQVGENQALVLASDPTSLIPSLGLQESAWLSVVLTANDVATSGCLPEYAQFVLNLPHSMSAEDLEAYWEHMHGFCRDWGIAITGGHTGFGDIGASTVSGGVTMFAQAELSAIRSAAFVRPDLDLIVTKSAALSSTAILARCFPNFIAKQLGQTRLDALRAMFYQMSVLPEVQALRSDAAVFEGVVAMHDVTEGGVLGAVYELCAAGEVGVQVEPDRIPLGPDQQAVCGLFNLDPYRCVGAGSLLIACEKDRTDGVLRLLRKAQIEAARIGETTAHPAERCVMHRGEKQELAYVEEDPYWRAFQQALADKLD